jgi:hypothetical protein
MMTITAVDDMNSVPGTWRHAARTTSGARRTDDEALPRLEAK